MKQTIFRIVSLATILVMAAVFPVSCGSAEPDPDPAPATVAVTGVSLSKTLLDLLEGDTETLTATVSPDNATNKKVSWKSSDTAVASVDDNGKVTAVKAGSATITVTADGGKTATCSVKVTEQAKIVITGNTAQVPVQGGTEEFKIQYNTSYTIEIEQSAQSWLHFVETKAMQSGTLVFKVDPNEGEARTGKATVKDNEGKVAPIALTFEQAPYIAVTSVQVAPETAELEVGETLTLTATVLPEDATDKTVTWTSDNESVASVSEDGVVTAKEKGTATITATAGEKTSTCSVTVKPSIYEIERDALEAFYKANDGDHWTRNDNWCSDKPLGDWYGVYMGSGRVIGISFWNNNLQGYIPEEIENLSELETLSLNNNTIQPSEFKPLPEELGNLKKLKNLSLQGYTFDGKIPEFLFDNLQDLESLAISNTYNPDPQPFPQGVTKLKKLRTLIINNAKLSGTLPSDMGYLYNLESLSLRGNNLEGAIPESFGNLKNLETINLGDNHFSGTIPSSLHMLENYWKLWPGIVYGNNFTLEELLASACPAPRSPKLTSISGNTLDLEAEFNKNDYTVLAMVQWSNGELEFFKQLEQLRQTNPGLGVITYFENNSDELGERYARDEEFKELLRQSGAGWESFIRYFTTIYPDNEAPLYCTPYQVMYPGGNNNTVVIGPDKTVVFTTLILDNMALDKHDEVIAYLEEILDSPIERYESSDYSTDKGVKLLQKASVGNGVDLVITGDAFSDRLIADGTFEGLALNAAENLFSAEPFKSLRNRFNVYLVNAVSSNEEYFNGCSTVFSGEFGHGSEVGGNNGKVLEYAREALSEDRMDNALVLVMMNSSKSGGTCYMLEPVDRSVYAGGASIAWSPYSDPAAVFGQSGNATTLVHELGGHGLGKLADEYYYFGTGSVGSHTIESVRGLHERGRYMNVDFTDNPANIIWSRFIGDPAFADEGIGAFQGGLSFEYGVWRPTERSLMFDSFSNPVFNAPSRAQIYTRIMKLSEGQDWQFDYEEFVKWDQAHPTKTSSAPATKSNYVEMEDTEPEGHVPPVILNKTWRQMIHK